MSEKDSGRPSASELDTIRRAQLGEPDAVRHLFGGYLGTVHRFALRMCRDEDRARDVAQESLLTALRSLGTYRAEASFATWLFTITRTHCGRMRRRAEREAPAEQAQELLQGVASADPEPDAQVMHGEVSDVLERALAALEPSDREVILLRDVEGLSTQDAARVLALSVAALKSRLHRARAALREQVMSALQQVPPPPRSACPDILAEISRQLEGDLTASQCDVLEQHVSQCPACADRCESVRQLLGACASLRDQEPLEDVHALLERAIDRTQEEQRSRGM